MGMVDMFNSQKADFHQMLETNMQLHVSEVIQKASIEINEDGAEAASACMIYKAILTFF